jgi:hypothetical protein
MTTLEILVHHQIAQSIIIAEGATEGKKSLIILALCNNHTLLISHRGVFFKKKMVHLLQGIRKGRSNAFLYFFRAIVYLFSPRSISTKGKSLNEIWFEIIMAHSKMTVGPIYNNE